MEVEEVLCLSAKYIFINVCKLQFTKKKLILMFKMFKF